MDYPEPEPQLCDFVVIGYLDYFCMFVGAGVGWFLMGYLSVKYCTTERRSPTLPTILAEEINQNRQ